MAIGTAAVDVQAIGAGGGSIAWIDEGGALRVGPESAGAEPGPVAYGRGGARVTLTDANIALGRLNGTALLAGALAVDVGAAECALDEQIAHPLGLEREAAAYGIVRVAAAGIARAIRAVAAARGLDPAELPLVAYGGAGPLLASAVSAEIGCSRVIVPTEPGTLCARGILLSDLSFDFVRTVLARADTAGWRAAAAAFAELAEAAEGWLASESVSMAERELRFVAEARYAGQSFEVSTNVPDPTSEGATAFLRAFAAAHTARYGRIVADRPVEIVNCRVTAVGKRPKPRFAVPARHGGRGPETRRAYFGTTAGWLDTPVVPRAALSPGPTLAGPLIVEEMSATTVIPPGGEAHVDTAGNLILSLNRAVAP